MYIISSLTNISKLFFRKLRINKNNIIDGYSRKSYSQEGEDLVLNRYFGYKQNGFYIDVGAHHPKRFSNTHFFYKKGWQGLNIDAKPDSMILFNKYRPRDINIEAAISEKEGDMTYYMFSESALNTFDYDLAMDRAKDNSALDMSECTINMLPLSKVLDASIKEGMHIDFMSIDVEGFDLSVLKSNDWVKYRPTYLLVECLDVKTLVESSDPIHKFLTSKDYIPIAKTYYTMFYKNIRGI
jgi:FkbM family methyltransferase